MKPSETMRTRGGARSVIRPDGRRSGRRRESGFTLIEVMVSLVIVAVGILGVTAMQTASISSSVLTRTYDSCTSLTSDALDRIYANKANWAEYAGGFRVSPSEGGSPPSGQAASNDYNDLRQSMIDMELQDAALEVVFTVDVPMAGLNTVTATLYWDHRGDNKQCVIESVMPR